MAHGNGNAELLEPLHVHIVGDVRALNLVAQIVHDLGDAAHADAADADEMNRADIERHARGRGVLCHHAPPIRSTRSARRSAASGLASAWAAAARRARSSG